MWLVDSPSHRSAPASPPLPSTWEGVAEMTVAMGWGVCCRAAVESIRRAGNRFLCLLLTKFPGAQPSSLSFVLSLELGREVGVTALQARGSLVECG